MSDEKTTPWERAAKEIMLEVATPALCASGPTKSAIERHAKIIERACREHAKAVQSQRDECERQFQERVSVAIELQDDLDRIRNEVIGTGWEIEKGSTFRMVAGLRYLAAQWKAENESLRQQLNEPLSSTMSTKEILRLTASDGCKPSDEVAQLRSQLAERDATIARLRTALEKIANMEYNESPKMFARKALDV